MSACWSQGMPFKSVLVQERYRAAPPAPVGTGRPRDQAPAIVAIAAWALLLKSLLSGADPALFAAAA